MSSIRFSLVSQAIDIASLAAELRDPAAGAVVTFDGRVRNHNAGQAVSGLEYQAYPALAISTGQRILEEEAARHGILAAQAAHRTGPLEIGEAAVWVGVASAHRGPAFVAGHPGRVLRQTKTQSASRPTTRPKVDPSGTSRTPYSTQKSSRGRRTQRSRLTASPFTPRPPLQYMERGRKKAI